MEYPNVLAQLKYELQLLERSKEKSIKSYGRGSINGELHKTHMKNLNPLIKEYQSAINKLN